MRANGKVVVLLCFCHAVVLGAGAHTEHEFVAKGREMLAEALDMHSCGFDDVEARYEDECWIYWEKDGFFNHFVTNDWSRAMCETALDRYLSWISTNDMSAFSTCERRIAKSALGQCRCMAYTNALDAIRAYALNTTAVDCVTAIETAVEFGGVDEAAASFIETIVTNNAQFSYNDISWAIPKYCDKLLAVNTNDAEAVAIRDRGVRLFYAKRHDWQDGTSLDNLFSACIDGYSASSNRLEYAQHVLSWTTNNDWRAMHDHFVTITNELLSSGQPLGVITVGAP